MLEFSFEKRRNAARKLQHNHPGMILLVIDSPHFVFEKTKFIVEPDKKIWELVFDIKKSGNIDYKTPIVPITYSGIVPPNSWTVAQLYHQHYSRDGFLYLKILKTDSAYG